MRFTEEQERIFNTALDAGETIKIEAFAGTGKTTTLVEFAKRNPATNFLYVAFNKSVQEHAGKVFPPNVECRTSHSLAYRYYVKNFKKKRIVSGFDYDVIDRIYNINNNEILHAVLITLKNFLHSDDRYILKDHIENDDLTPQEEERVIEYAEEIWEDLFVSNSEITAITHDCYLKKYQLSEPDLSEKYDCIMLDEAQDTNPATADIILSQSCKKIVVGDSHQSIYSFRGVVNILSEIDADYTMYLTKSFRFPESIAQYANLILFQFKNENRKIEGLGKLTKKEPESTAYITRTNLSLFDVAASLSEKGKSFVLDNAMLLFLADIEYVHALYTHNFNRRIKSKYYKFKKFSKLVHYADEFDDYSLKAICNMVKKYSDDINLPEVIRKIRKHNNAASKIFLYTAHRAKGMEFDSVILENFFPQGNMATPKRHHNFHEEINIIYVAITRAKYDVRLSEDIKLLIKNKDAA
jgi:F-box protein 18 (helicase)